ncbi:MAG: ABC transporter substrate-binding protein [Chloroflexi bacterium]|nr:ABC transporter substrate-binding protein [Chloroflexota bacterium]
MYTASPPELATALGDQFTKNTGVKVNLFQGDTGTILAKLDAEKARPQADIVVLADWSAGQQMAQEGQLLPYIPPTAKTVPAQFKDPGGAFVAQGETVVAIAYNTDKVTTPPTEWDDLLQPQWKDKLTMPDPSGSGTAYEFLATFLKMRGDAGWQYFNQLKANGLIVPGTNAKALDPVTSGSRYAMIGAADHTTLASIASGEKLKLVYPKSGTIMSPRPLVILKSTKNPDAAKAFLDFVMSDAGQKIVAQYWVTPARPEIPVRDGHVQPSSLTLWPEDLAYEAQNRSTILDRFTSQIVK